MDCACGLPENTSESPWKFFGLHCPGKEAGQNMASEFGSPRCHKQDSMKPSYRKEEWERYNRWEPCRSVRMLSGLNSVNMKNLAG